MHEESDTLRAKMRSLFDGDDVPAPELAGLSGIEPSAPPAEALEPTRPTIREEVLAGELAFVEEAARGDRVRSLEERHALVVQVWPRASSRGRLEATIDAAIEDALGDAGEVAPGFGGGGIGTPADERLSDQLFRARRAGKTGLALVMASLEPAATPMGALESVDSAILRFFAKATRERPLALLLDAADKGLGAYSDPIPLEAAIAPPKPAIAPPAPAPAPAPAPPPVVVATKVAEATAGDSARVDAILARPPMAEPECPALHAEPVAEAPRAPARSAADLHPFVQALSSMKGPQPLASLEAAFATAYVPLLDAHGRGETDARAHRVMDEFRTSFAKAYEAVSPTLYARPKRPKMVLDAPTIAQKLARLHNARTSTVLVVDSMRYDVGRLVRRHLEALLAGSGSLTQEEILWALLPTTSVRQLDGLGRGDAALRSAEEPTEGADSIRGRAAEVVRRVRVGHREIMKLDTLRARLPALGGSDVVGVHDELPGLAESTAEAIAKFSRTLAPRTLLYILGDHGFTVDHEGQVTTGGASPEEVLVPAFAFMVGALH